MNVYLHGIGIYAPGLPDWHSAKPVLAGTQAYTPAALPPLHLPLLQANERRRLPATAKIALRAALDATAGMETAELSSVFASSEGDMGFVDQVCSALALPQRPVSPTAFHNSVHNAPAGYWAMATGAQTPSTSLSAYDDTFAAGLLEAVTLALDEQNPVLLVVYDHPAPPALHRVRPLQAPFAAGLVIHKDTISSGNGVSLALMVSDTIQEDISTMNDGNLESLRQGNPAARGLPLLQALAQGGEQTVYLPYLDTHLLQLRIEPCG